MGPRVLFAASMLQSIFPELLDNGQPDFAGT
jgi:hypothetical protein